jgi:hypothetical protein
MTQPATPSLPPELAATVPAWAWRLLSALLLFAGPVTVWVDPGGHLDTGATQAAIILGFMVAAVVAFLIHATLAAVHEKGWKMAAAVDVEHQAVAEAKALLPQMQALYDQAAPLVDKLPGYDTLAADVAAVKGQVDAIPADQLSTVAAALHALTAGGPVTVTPAAPAPAQTDPAATGTVA